MDPVTIGALISAGTTLVSGLMGAANNADIAKKKMQMDAQNMDFQAKMQGSQTMSMNRQKAFEQLMSGYKGALTG